MERRSSKRRMVPAAAAQASASRSTSGPAPASCALVVEPRRPDAEHRKGVLQRNLILANGSSPARGPGLQWGGGRRCKSCRLAPRIHRDAQNFFQLHRQDSREGLRSPGAGIGGGGS